MIALDSSALISYLEGDASPVSEVVDVVLAERQACLPPVVLSELLSDPKLPPSVAQLLDTLPLLALSDGYWSRAGALRASVLAMKKRARLADTLVAQSCLDHDVSLVTADRDFRHFVKVAGLQLIS